MKMLTPTDACRTSAALAAGTQRKKTLRKCLFYATLVLIAILLISHVAWDRSGSNQWQLAMDDNGIKVWTIKTPGSNLIRVKGVTRIQSSLSGMVKLLEDLESCVDANCYDASVLSTIETLPDHYAAFVRFKFDIPGLQTRDYVLYQEHKQDPHSKQLNINIIAAPNAIPRDECCVRITHLHNSWKITPLSSNELDIEFIQDTDIGGMPYFVANYALRQGVYEILHSLQNLMNMDKYRHAQVDYIQELPVNR